MTTLEHSEAATHVASVSLKLPPFWLAGDQVWFAQTLLLVG